MRAISVPAAGGGAYRRSKLGMRRSGGAHPGKSRVSANSDAEL